MIERIAAGFRIDHRTGALHRGHEIGGVGARVGGALGERLLPIRIGHLVIPTLRQAAIVPAGVSLVLQRLFDRDPAVIASSQFLDGGSWQPNNSLQLRARIVKFDGNLG